MRDWILGAGAPLALTLAADFRLSAPDYTDDHIWELELGGGDPPALALRSTYGLRARSMRIFPRFTAKNQTVMDPAGFAAPPQLRRFYPNFLVFECSPFPDVPVIVEYWVPTSQTIAGRFTVTNHTLSTFSFALELCGQLVPFTGKSFAPASMQSVIVLAGRSEGLVPVIFMTGGPQPGPGPYPSLTLDLILAEGETRQITWVQAALGDPDNSFELARHTAARPWDAERAKIERVNAAQTVEVYTGDPDWDAAFALAQTSALSLFFNPTRGQVPYPSFVLARQPDHGHSPLFDGSDYSSLWSGQSPLESYYLASLLPGAPELAGGLLRNFLAVQTAAGGIDGKPGLAGQRGRWLAAPFLASLAWQAYRTGAPEAILAESFPGLMAFYRQWFGPERDRDQDGFPEWDHPLQSSFEDNLAFTVWQTGGQGADISFSESPALASALCQEGKVLSRMAARLGKEDQQKQLEEQTRRLAGLVEACWDEPAAFYHCRDRESHSSPMGMDIAEHAGSGKFGIRRSFERPLRLLVRIEFEGQAVRRPEVILKGRRGKTVQSEQLARMDFQWGTDRAVATTRGLYSGLSSIAVAGLEKLDRVIVQVMDFSREDHTLFLPLWAEIPDASRARELVRHSLLAADRFGRRFGIPAYPSVPDPGADSVCMAVHLPWNQFIGEGLLAYGLRQEAAQLIMRLMDAILLNLREQHAFARTYHAETGAGSGERNSLQGLAPLGLFLKVLGVEIRSPVCVLLSGKNPFPWPVTVKYRGLTVTRQVDSTEIVFPDGGSYSLNDPTEAVVSVE